jgi:integrase
VEDDATRSDEKMAWPTIVLMASITLVDIAGRPRPSATLPGYHQGRPPRNKGLRYPADPRTVEEIIAVMRVAGDDPDGVRLRGLIVVLWRAGLRISEALSSTERDLDAGREAILVRNGKGGKRREVGMDRWAWEQLAPWLALRATPPSARCSAFCADRPAALLGVRRLRTQLHQAAALARVRRIAPHQLRHAHAGGDVARGRPTASHPAPAGTRKSRHHLRLSAWHR